MGSHHRRPSSKVSVHLYDVSQHCGTQPHDCQIQLAVVSYYLCGFTHQSLPFLCLSLGQKGRQDCPHSAEHAGILLVRKMISPSLRDELRLHGRYIRDTLVPILSRQPRVTHSDTVLLRSIFRKLESTHVTLDLLRYSRIEKALMVIAATGAATVRFSASSFRFWYRVMRRETLEETISNYAIQSNAPNLKDNS